MGRPNHVETKGLSVETLLSEPPSPFQDNTPESNSTPVKKKETLPSASSPSKSSIHPSPFPTESALSRILKSSRHLRIKPPYLFLRPGSCCCCCCCEGDQARDEKHERRGRMSSIINKRQQARNERILQDLLKSVAGNDRCADCGTKNPGWSMHF